MGRVNLANESDSQRGRYVANYIEAENVWEVFTISDNGIVGRPAEGRRTFHSYTAARRAISKLEENGNYA